VLYPVSDLGERSIERISVGPYDNSVEIQYASISARPRDTIRYQLRLGGSEDWSAPTERRVIHYARLSPGHYAFEVRAINAGGLASARSAAVEFTIAPPVWRRQWFLTLAGLLILCIIYAAHRYRLWHAVGLERIRGSLAMDLHDEVGSGLAEIAIASELAKRASADCSTDLLERIAERCRELRALMADIVWAVDPRQDDTPDLVGRIRHATYSLLEACECRIEFVVNNAVPRAVWKLAPDARRHVLLVAREALTNVARHSDATEVRVEMDARSEDLHLRIADNGRGFDTEAHRDSHGLLSLSRRSAALKAILTIESGVGKGTSIDLRVPLR
jgi:two-component sensor histidine kinase